MNPRFLSLCAGVSALLAAPTAVFADDDDDEEIPFEVAEVFFELNNTDGDLGIHALIDGDAWKRLRIEDINERRVLSVNVRGRLRRQGLTEIFFESAEPTFDELPPPTFFSRFPEGTYEISGRTLEGDELESGLFSQTQTFRHTFDTPGEYYYHCEPHSNMHGLVTVLPLP